MQHTHCSHVCNCGREDLCPLVAMTFIALLGHVGSSVNGAPELCHVVPESDGYLEIRDGTCACI
jgi:hypothetical protein